MRLVFCLFYPTIYPTNYPTIFCIKIYGQKIRRYILCMYLQYYTTYSACGWGSWIRKERNSDCSPQAQSRQQRMTESEEGGFIHALHKYVILSLFLALF